MVLCLLFIFFTHNWHNLGMVCTVTVQYCARIGYCIVSCRIVWYRSKASRMEGGIEWDEEKG